MAFRLGGVSPSSEAVRRERVLGGLCREPKCLGHRGGGSERPESALRAFLRDRLQ